MYVFLSSIAILVTASFWIKELMLVTLIITSLITLHSLYAKNFGGVLIGVAFSTPYFYPNLSFLYLVLGFIMVAGILSDLSKDIQDVPKTPNGLSTDSRKVFKDQLIIKTEVDEETGIKALTFDYVDGLSLDDKLNVCNEYFKTLKEKLETYNLTMILIPKVNTEKKKKENNL